MTVETGQRLRADLSFIDADGRAVGLAQLRGDHQGIVLFFMRQASCLICLRHVRALAAMRPTEHGIAGVVVVPGAEAGAARVRRVAGAGLTVVSSPGAESHRAVGLSKSLLMQHSGTILLDARDTVRYRLSATLPTGSFDGPALLAAIDAG
jgi:peroxiredoxin